MRIHRNLGWAMALVVALGAPAVAGMMDHGRRGPGDGMGGHEGPLLTMMLHHSQELGLSAEQEKGLRDLRTEFAKESVRRTAEIRVAQIEVYALLDQERWDLAQIKPKAKQIAALEGELRVARLKTLAAGRALLTPQQLEKLKQVGHRVRPMGEQGGMGHSMRGPGGQRASAPGGSPAPPHAH